MSARHTPMTRILVLGAKGMLGSMVVRVFSSCNEFEVVGTARHAENDFRQFELGHDELEELLSSTQCDWVVNAIGVLHQHIDEAEPSSIASAIAVNAEFPHRLAAATRDDQRVINFATDGVYSGRGGPYDEAALHDARDVYALTKSLGEAHAPHVVNLR